MNLNKSIFIDQRFQSKDCFLAPISPEGISDFHAYSVLPGFFEHLEFSASKTIQDTQHYLDKLIHRHSKDNAFYWFIKSNKTSQIIGTFAVHDIDWRKLDLEISYGLSPKFWGKGYFLNILKTMLVFLFTKGFYRISARTSMQNKASIKSLEKVGFVVEGNLRDYYLDESNARYDCAVLGLLKGDFIE